MRLPCLTARPGSAPVCLPASMTGVPLTITYSMPMGNCLGSVAGGGRADGVGIEDGDVGVHAVAQDAAVLESEPLGGE